MRVVVLKTVGLAVLVLVAIVAVLFISDYGVEATITSKGQDSQGSFIVATTKIGGLGLRQDLPPQQWFLVQVGNFVVYHIGSGNLQVYQREGGQLLYSG